MLDRFITMKSRSFENEKLKGLEAKLYDNIMRSINTESSCLYSYHDSFMN
jgi:hypothetical protein